MRRPSVVVWNDAHASLEEVAADEVAGRHKPSVIHTYGYIVRSDEVGVSIAAEWLPAENGGDETFRGVTFIPRGMVIEEHKARQPRRPKESTNKTVSVNDP